MSGASIKYNLEIRTSLFGRAGDITLNGLDGVGYQVFVQTDNVELPMSQFEIAVQGRGFINRVLLCIMCLVENVMKVVIHPLIMASVRAPPKVGCQGGVLEEGHTRPQRP
jgi:hypothetical protein